MTPSPTTIEFDRSLTEAEQTLSECGIRHLPVTAGTRFVGVISDRDLKLARSLESTPEREIQVGDVCTKDAYIVEPTALLDQVMKEMARGHYGCVVVATSGEVKGIFTTVDACREFSDYLSSQSRFS